MITAKKFFTKNEDKYTHIEMLKEYGKLCAEEALKRAAENAKVRITQNIQLANITPHYQVKHGEYVIADKQSILNTKLDFIK